MWLLEMILLSIVAGTILGLTWRVVEDQYEKYKARQKSASKE